MRHQSDKANAKERIEGRPPGSRVRDHGGAAQKGRSIKCCAGWTSNHRTWTESGLIGHTASCEGTQPHRLSSRGSGPFPQTLQHLHYCQQFFVTIRVSCVCSYQSVQAQRSVPKTPYSVCQKERVVPGNGDLGCLCECLTSRNSEGKLSDASGNQPPLSSIKGSASSVCWQK